MYFEKLEVGHMGNNCYILSGDNKNAIVIDSAGGISKIEKTLEKNGWQAEAVLYTHGHYDHTGGWAHFEKRYFDSRDTDLCPAITDYLEPKDGETLHLAGLEIKVIYIGGHSAGCNCYLIGDKLFTGDTLFHGTIGRTDFATSNHGLLIKNIKNKLFTLPKTTKVYPGHGGESTIGWEIANNPHF